MAARSSRPPLRSLLSLVALALALRAGAVVWSLVDHPEFFRPDPTRIEAQLSDPSTPFVHPLGFEVSNVAWSLACAGEGFASPFGGDTGPTGWVSPGIVAVWATVFAVAGCFTPGSVALLLALGGTASAAMVLLAAAAGARLGGARTGRVAALLVACSPWDLLLFHAASLMDINLYALALLGLIALLLALWRQPSRGRLSAFAVGSAVATLVNPALFFAAVAGCTFLLVRPPGPGLRPLRAVTLFVLIHLAVVGPWIVHQHRAVGGWFFVKSNASFEIALGNRPEVAGILRPETFEEYHPSRNPEEYRNYRRLGERAYVERHFDRFVRSFEPARFARATGRRFLRLFYWYIPEPWQGAASVWGYRLLTLLPGLLFIVYPLARVRLDKGDALVYLATAGYTAPFLVTGVMERYTLALTVPALLLASRLVAERLPRRSGARGEYTGGPEKEVTTVRGSTPSGPAR